MEQYKRLEIAIVDWDVDSEEGGITALFMDGNCQMWGDYQHNHIRDLIDGFIDGLIFCNRPHRIRTGTVPSEYDEDGEVIYVQNAPDRLEDAGTINWEPE